MKKYFTLNKIISDINHLNMSHFLVIKKKNTIQGVPISTNLYGNNYNDYN